jgi:hypothetical protein
MFLGKETFLTTPNTWFFGGILSLFQALWLATARLMMMMS